MNRNISRKDMENTALFRAQGSILAGQITDEYMEPYVSLIKTQ